MSDIPSHHFIYGLTEDYITGDKVVDTDDERYRQKLARFLVEEKGYDKKDVEVKRKIETLFSSYFVVSTIDITVTVKDKRLFIIRYGPGSLVTRERSAIAAARVLEDKYQIPFAVVTNGEDAEFLDTLTGEVLETGLNSIPSKEEAIALFGKTSFAEALSGPKHERELRILNTYDVEICCAGGPCALPNAPEG